MLPTHAKLCLLRSCQQGSFLISHFLHLPFFFLSPSLSFFFLFISDFTFLSSLLLPFPISFLQTPELRGTEEPTMCWHT